MRIFDKVSSKQIFNSVILITYLKILQYFLIDSNNITYLSYFDAMSLIIHFLNFTPEIF